MSVAVITRGVRAGCIGQQLLNGCAQLVASWWQVYASRPCGDLLVVQVIDSLDSCVLPDSPASRLAASGSVCFDAVSVHLAQNVMGPAIAFNGHLLQCHLANTVQL